MDLSVDNDWLTCKNDQIDDIPPVGNIARSWQWRERGLDPLKYPPNKMVMENNAEDILVQKPLKIRCCDLPGYPRSTFLMVFSPDGTKVASTHGNHNVYVSELSSGKHVRILKGHPRTPWCIAFHPSHTQLIGSGCLGGQVRVWDISSGGSEVWNVRNETVIASIAFHPREQLLVIATSNELYFWDWSQPAPFTKVSTNNINEKVRYVAFDALGYKLVTGISLWAGPANSSILIQQNPTLNVLNETRRDDSDDSPPANPTQENAGSGQDMIVNSYQNLVQRYDSLVRNYHRLILVRHRLTNTPPPPSTMDRGTDPMDADIGQSWRAVGTAPRADHADPGPSTSQQGDADGDSEGSRLLNLDVLSFDTDPTVAEAPTEEHSIFGSRSSAFQPLAEGVTFRTVDQNERTTRLLPNPFSSTTAIRTRPTMDDSTESNASRTSIYTSSRPETSIGRAFLERRRNSSPSQNTSRFHSTFLTDSAALAAGLSGLSQATPSTSNTSTTTDRPTMTNSSTQMSPMTVPVAAQTINESLDLIRDILRDSGTRLLNLITNMSTTLASVERSMPRRGSQTQSDDNESVGRTRGIRPRVRLLSPRASLRRSILSSSSDSDSDQSLEVNIFRTRNTTFQEDGADATTNTPDANIFDPPPNPASRINRRGTGRMVFELSNDLINGETIHSQDTGGINVSLLSDRFRVRNHNEPNETLQPSNETLGPSNDNPGLSNNNPELSTINPELSTINPELSNINPELSNINPELSNINPELSNINPEPSNDTPEGLNETSEPPIRDHESSPEPQASTSQPRPRNAEFTPRPSTSRDNFWSSGNSVSSEEAYRKVRSGVTSLQKHTILLTNLWLRGNRTTMRELRTMWETLRRRILMLHRETGRQDVPSYYTRSLLERCMMLTDMADTSRPRARNNTRSEGTDRNIEENRDSSNVANNSNSNLAGGQNASNEVNDRPSVPTRPLARSTSSHRSSPSLRRRLQSNLRWRPEDEMRRRTRNPGSNRLAPRYNTRTRRDIARAIEISATRHEIRMRAMQVLSVMFNMMMMCLEERGLSQLIINMLRTLKKALALTCLMLITNRNNARGNNNPTGSAQRTMDALNVVRIQNADHFDPVNVDGPDDPASPMHTGSRSNDSGPSSAKREKKETVVDDEKPSTSNAPSVTDAASNTQEPPAISPILTQQWSNRLAVLISAANRNNSATARTRRELYLEGRRQKALHRTNPSAHPIFKRRALPPVSTHRIPAMRHLPSRLNKPRMATPRSEHTDEPVAGPSNQNDSQESRDEVLNEFEHRVNLIRLAHLQAVRLRNAARTRFRRLQTIRLYTPSSVREMFTFTRSDDNPGNRSPNGPELGNRRSFAAYRPRILTPRSDADGRPSEAESTNFHSVLNNVAMPLMQVNDLPASEGPGNQQRLPRIHEYLQPIILAQNAMVVDEEGGGDGGGARRLSAGMAGLLDAGIISETLPAPSHRVQAWDFTGATPDIADNTKNVVVQRCRIHNDASIDISRDGRLLVALLPTPRPRTTSHWLGIMHVGVYSLEWPRLGQCLHTAALEQSAVSVALSPTARHLAVGLGSRRFTTTPHARTNVFALLYRLEPRESSSRTGLLPIKELEQNWEHGFTSLNCLRWAPQPGQGLVYANNTGQLIVMS